MPIQIAVKFKYRFKILSWIKKDPWTPTTDYDRWQNIDKMIKWAKANLKPNTWRYFGEYTNTPNEMAFSEESDALMFKMLYREFIFGYNIVHTIPFKL